MFDNHNLVEFLAQTTASRSWWEVNIFGVLVGGLLAGSVTLVGAWLNHKRERRARWDDTRRSVYVEFLGALTCVYDSGLSTAGTMPSFDMPWPEGCEYQSALRRLADAEDAVKILASAPVVRSASILVTKNQARLAPAHAARSAKVTHEALAAARVAEEKEKEWVTERESFIEAIHEEIGLPRRK